MLHDAVAHYHDLLTTDNLADESRTILDEGLERSKLIFGGRRLSPYLRPHFVLEEDFLRITAICETVWSAIQKVKDACIDNPAIIDELGVTEIERDLISIDPGYRAVSPTARLDSFLTDQAYSFVELNGESPPVSKLTRMLLTKSIRPSGDEEVCRNLPTASPVWQARHA